MTQLNQTSAHAIDAIRNALPLDSISGLLDHTDSLAATALTAEQPLIRPVATTENGLEVYCMSSKAPEFERDVLALRAEVYGRPASQCRDDIDEYSEHYVAYNQGIAHYAMRSTRASAGRIECEECYPWQLISRFRDQLCSNGRLVRNPKLAGGRERTTRFMAAVWNDLIRLGVRMDIANATSDLLRYHTGFGYSWLQVPTFRHPVFDTVSYTIVMTIDNADHGTLSPLLTPVGDPLRLSDLSIPCVTDIDAFEHAA